MDERVGAALDFVGGAEGEEVAVGHHGDAVGDAKGQVPVVGDDNGGDLDAFLEVFKTAGIQAE